MSPGNEPNDYCTRHGVAFAADPAAGDTGGEPEPLLPEPPAKPKGSKLNRTATRRVRRAP